MKFFEAQLPTAFKETEQFYLPPQGAAKPKTSEEANVPRNVEITIQPEEKGGGCRVQIDELVPPPP